MDTKTLTAPVELKRTGPEGPGVAVYEGAGGDLVFHNRHHLITNTKSTSIQTTLRATGASPNIAAGFSHDGELWQKRGALLSILRGLLVEKTFLFIGFGFEDEDFKRLFGEIGVFLGQYQRNSYVVMPRDPAIPVADWQKWVVDIYKRHHLIVVSCSAAEGLEAINESVAAPPPTRPIRRKWESRNKTENVMPMGLPNLGQWIVPFNLPPHMHNIRVVMDVRILDDGGNSSNWAGVRIRGLTSHHTAGYLIYIRSAGTIDVMSVEEQSILKTEPKVVADKNGWYQVEVRIVEARITVEVGGELVVDIESKLVPWDGGVFFHTWGVKADFNNIEVFEGVEEPEEGDFDLDSDHGRQQ